MRITLPFVLLCLWLSGCGSEFNNRYCVPYFPGLTGWWNGTFTSGTAALDHAWLSNNSGVLSSEVSLANGRLGNSFLYNGISGKILIKNSTSFKPKIGMSVSGWIKSNLNARSSSRHQVILAKGGYSDTSFVDPTAWKGFDITTASFQNASQFNSFRGGVFDGRYIYFSPFNSFTTVARYDTQLDFSTASSWSGFDILNSSIPGVSTYGGYQGLVFDGRYVYFVPWFKSTNHGKVARYDTLREFSDPESWSGFDLTNGTYSGAANYRGYMGGVFDGRYVYLIPATGSRKAARYDIQKDFTSPLSWEGFDLSVFSGTSNFIGGTFDGRYVYYSPWGSGTGSVAARFDTQQTFTTTSSWETYTISSSTFPNASNFLGYVGAGFDGRYIYYAPLGAGSTSGRVARFDTQGIFSSTNSWSGFDTSSSSETLSQGIYTIYYNGRYLFLMQTGANAIATRYDPNLDFNTTTSWKGFNVANASFPNAGSYTSFVGAVSDGRYLYFISSTSGKILQHDMSDGKLDFSLKFSDVGSDGLSSSLPGPSFMLQTREGFFTVQSNTEISANTWHHLAASYNGKKLTLYIDGNPVAQQSAHGALDFSDSDLSIGSLVGGNSVFNGSINDVRFFSQSLSDQEVKALYLNEKLFCNVS